MNIPVIAGVIDRRLLINFHVDPEVMQSWLPEPFRPKLAGGLGMVGICLIRLKDVRPRFLPRFLGASSENAAHRAAVTWDCDGQRGEGVFIPRRDTSSRFNALAGGRIFPGVHHHARFVVREEGDRYSVEVHSDDGETRVAVEGRVAGELPASSVFSSIDEASEFFRCGSLGYSATGDPSAFDGLELRTFSWNVVPLAIDRVESSFFEDHSRFARGSVEFDSALLMRGIAHEWRARPPLYADAAGIAS